MDALDSDVKEIHNTVELHERMFYVIFGLIAVFMLFIITRSKLIFIYIYIYIKKYDNIVVK